MGLLAGTLYDPAAAVTKATTAAAAMAAVDTTNLRATFIAPTSGRVLVRLSCTIHGAASLPQILLGVLDGATVKARQAPRVSGAGAATSLANATAEFLVTGLTGGTSYTWDAAYGIETGVASSGIKYGGPNDTTADNAFGGFAFEVWEA